MNDENTNGTVARRTVIKGAAWSLPVIATAVAVPSAAASTQASGSWSLQQTSAYNPQSGTVRIESGFGVFPLGSGPYAASATLTWTVDLSLNGVSVGRKEYVEVVVIDAGGYGTSQMQSFDVTGLAQGVYVATTTLVSAIDSEGATIEQWSGSVHPNPWTAEVWVTW